MSKPQNIFDTKKGIFIIRILDSRKKYKPGIQRTKKFETLTTLLKNLTHTKKDKMQSTKMKEIGNKENEKKITNLFLKRKKRRRREILTRFRLDLQKRENLKGQTESSSFAHWE